MCCTMSHSSVELLTLPMKALPAKGVVALFLAYSLLRYDTNKGEEPADLPSSIVGANN